MKIIDNSTMTPVLKVGTPPREYGSEEIKLGIPGIRGESDQTLPPSERDESVQTRHRVGEPGYSGHPNYGIGESRFPGPPGGRDESEEAPVDNKFITSDEVFSRLDNSLHELGSEYLNKLDTLSSEHKTEYNNLFAEHNSRTYKLTSESINDLNLSEHYSVFNVIGTP